MNIILIVMSVVLSGHLSNDTWMDKIIPLRSNRADVEKILGKPKETHCTNCTYETEADLITVRYAINKCEGFLSGWNVPKDNVLSFTIRPKKFVTMKDISFQTGGLIVTGEHDGSRRYLDTQTGLKYVFGPQANLQSITRWPVDADNPLRCSGFPVYRITGATYSANESFFYPEEGIARIENGLIFLRQSAPGFKLYALVYSGENLKGRKFAEYLKKLRRKFKKELSLSPPTLEIIIGGQKKRFGTDFFYLKENESPPCPLPDFASW